MSEQKTNNDTHWLTGQFRNWSDELKYRDSIEHRVRLETRLALIVVAVLFALFGITDYNLLGLTREYYLLLAMRITVVSSCLGLAFIIGRWGGFTKSVWLHALPLWIVATGIVLIVPLRPESLLTQVTAIVVAIMAFYLLIPNLLTVSALASLFLSISFITAAVVFAGISLVGTITIGLLIIVANIVGYTALLRIEILQRKQFALLCEEREQNQHLQKEIAHRQSLEDQLRIAAELDALTGVDSRGHFMKRAKALLQRSSYEKEPFSLFMIDVDHFKRVNDTWGHTYGDRILTRIVDACQQSLRPNDIIGRFGGEEFVVGLPNTDEEAAQAIAKRIKDSVAAIELEGEMSNQRLSVTIGVAVASPDEDLDSLIMRADDRLYVGKREGRNRVVV